MNNLENAEIGQQIVNKNVAGDGAEKGDLDALLSKKFILEMRKNMVMNLLKMASQKNTIIDRRNKYKFVDTMYRIQRHPLFSGFMYIITAANLIVLIYDHYPDTD
jgi:hypothetical protein